MKRFNMIDEEFICENCGKKVENNCKGILEPIDIEKYNSTYKIVYKCEKCGKLHKNIMAKDDDMNVIINLSAKK